MLCPYCDNKDSRVTDSRPSDDYKSIRRRRECIECTKRFTTYEKIEITPIMIIKKDGKRESFSRDKVLNGIIRSCEKRPISIEEIEFMVDNLEKQIYNSLEKEITSKYIGILVMDLLKNLDEIAYVRFASVYREFKDLTSFIKELDKLMKNSTGKS